MEKIKQKIIKFIQKQANGKPAIIGISGGVDSAVVAYLTCEALGKKKVYGIIAPSASNTKEEMKLAQLVTNLLEIEYEIINIEKIIISFKESCDFFENKKVLGNLKARIRMCLLYGLANASKSLVIGTGNKSEITTGYFTKFGDAACDILPIGDLYKTEVWELAKYLKIPQAIINAVPTAGLWPNQSDEVELGMSYKKLDAILQNKKAASPDSELVKRFVKISQHKRKMPLICRIAR